MLYNIKSVGTETAPTLCNDMIAILFCLFFEIGIELAPFGNRRHDAERNYFVAESAEVLVTLFESGFFLGCAVNRAEANPIFGDGGLHGHENMFEALVVDINACRPSEGGTPHSCGDHLDREICRALER